MPNQTGSRLCAFHRPSKGSGIDPNEWLAQELEKHDNICGFGTIDLDKPDLAKQAETIANLGFKGVKLHPAYQQFNILADELKDFYAAAEELGLLLCFHLGVHWHRIKDYHPSSAMSWPISTPISSLPWNM